MTENAPFLVWPPSLELPPAGPIIVYLDLNHWIGMAQALSGHPKGACNIDVLDACKAARASNKAKFIISGAIYAEVLKIKDPKQRQRLAEVIEELTNFETLVSRVVVMELELSAIVDSLAELHTHVTKVPLIGCGVRHAFGLRSAFAILGPCGDERESYRKQYGAEHSMLLWKIQGATWNAPSCGALPMQTKRTTFELWATDQRLRRTPWRVELNKSESLKTYWTQTQS